MDPVIPGMEASCAIDTLAFIVALDFVCLLSCRSTLAHCISSVQCFNAVYERLVPANSELLNFGVAVSAGAQGR